MEKYDLRVADIFSSIDGEVNGWGQGRFTTFLRLAGCNLKCKYCDTADTQKYDSHKHETLTVFTVIDRIKRYHCRNITITGGEPLLQITPLAELCKILCEDKKLFSFGRPARINIETNGTIFPSGAERLTETDLIRFTVDYKIGENFHPLWYKYLTEKDFLKIVICDKDDFFKADKFLSMYEETLYNDNRQMIPVALSIRMNEGPNDLSGAVEVMTTWARADNPNSSLIFLSDLSKWSLNFQIHKLINLK